MDRALGRQALKECCLVIPFEFSLLRIVMREVWGNMEAHNLGGMVQGQGYLERIMIVNLYPMVRHNSSCFISMTPLFLPATYEVGLVILIVWN